MAREATVPAGPGSVVAARTIYGVSVRGLLAGRRWTLAAGLDAVYLLVALVLALAAQDEPPQRYSLDLFRTLALPVLLPFVALIFSSDALGSEVEDRTLIYLTLRPVGSPVIVLAKFVACAVVTIAAVWLALIPAWLMLGGLTGPVGLLPALLLGSAAGALAYAAIFLLLGLLLRRALLIGAVYILLWETAIAAISNGAAHLSVQFYALTIARGVLRADDLFPSDVLKPLPGLATAVIFLLVVMALALGLTMRWLRRVELR
jgi:ABC-2 type transport system permease protein